MGDASQVVSYFELSERLNASEYNQLPRRIFTAQGYCFGNPPISQTGEWEMNGVEWGIRKPANESSAPSTLSLAIHHEMSKRIREKLATQFQNEVNAT
jgi:hypothetical protein